MITECDIRQWNKYCREDIIKIPGYFDAKNGIGRYDCHHINELTFKRRELIKMKMYYHRPASELKIMRREDHLRLHHTGVNSHMYKRGDYVEGEKNGMWKGDNATKKSIRYRERRRSRRAKLKEL